MSQRLYKPLISVAEYLEGEREAEVRHEYVAGKVYAMACASDRHNRIALNVAAALNSQLGAGPCETFISDMKLYVAPDVFYYPDVMVACDDPIADSYFRRHPVLLVEVISPSTERNDRNEKLLAYKSIPSLQEYVIVYQDETHVDVHRRTAEGWTAEEFSHLEDEVILNSISLTLTIADIYRNVRFDWVNI